MFNLIRIKNGRINVPEPEFYEASASEKISVGQALVLNAGKLTKCAETTKPTFVAMGHCAADSTDRSVAVMRVDPCMEFCTRFTANPSALTVGSKVTISSDAMAVTATTTNGVATIIDTLGAAAIGDECIVSFI